MQIQTKAITRILATSALQHVVAGNYTGALYGAYLGLFTAISPPASPDSVLADLTEATFAGYARQAVTWAAETDSSDGFAQLLGGLLSFTPTDAVTPNTIVGVFLASAITAGTLWSLEMLPAAIPLVNTHTTLNYVPAFGTLFAGDYDAGVVVP